MSTYGESRCLSELRDALASEDWVLVRRLLLENWTWLVSEKIEEMRRALLAFPIEVVKSDALLRAARELFVGRGVTAQFPGALPSDPTELDILGSRPDVAELLAMGTVQASLLRFAGQLAEGASLVMRLERVALSAVRSHSESISMALPILRLQWAITCQLAGDRAYSTILFRRAYTGAEALGIGFVMRNAAGSTALNHALAGEPSAARVWLARWREAPLSQGRLEEMVRVSGLVASALLALEDLDLGGAAAALDELGEIRDGEELWAFALYAHCQLALLSGQPQQGLDLIDRLRLVHGRPWTNRTFSGSLLIAAEIDLQCAAGSGNAAQVTINEYMNGHPLVRVATARFALLTGDADRALTESASLTVGTGRGPRALVDGLLVQAAAAARMGYADDALGAWQRAVAVAVDVDTARPFTLLPPGSLSELRALGAKVPETSTAGSSQDSVFPDEVTVVTLSARELAVLTSLAQGLPLTEIAEKSFVSLNTVKSQAQSTYRKLGVNNRNDAVRAAVTLRILSS